MELSPARDIPLLQQVLRSGFVTGNQLYEFMRLEQTEGSRQAFDHRVRRLVGHGLIEKRPGLARGRHQVYSISKDGASVLIDAGELFGRQLGKRVVGPRFALDLGSVRNCRRGHGIPCRLNVAPL